MQRAADVHLDAERVPVQTRAFVPGRHVRQPMRGFDAEELGNIHARDFIRCCAARPDSGTFRRALVIPPRDPCPLSRDAREGAGQNRCVRWTHRAAIARHRESFGTSKANRGRKLMDRRDFLKVGGVGLGALLIPIHGRLVAAEAADHADGCGDQEAPRRRRAQCGEIERRDAIATCASDVICASS